MSDDLFDPWCEPYTDAHGEHLRILLLEKPGARRQAINRLVDAMQQHYQDPDITARRLARLGAPKTARLFKEHLPTRIRARSGELGEILATEYVIRQLRFRVPVFRLRYKDGRNMALRGDDIFGITWVERKPVLLKGEVKSRSAIDADTVTEAVEALRRAQGRPTRHTMLFVAERLRETGNDRMALILERLVLAGMSKVEIHHLLFVLSGNDPSHYFVEHLEAYTGNRRQYAVGLQIADHQAFIGAVFRAASNG